MVNGLLWLRAEFARLLKPESNLNYYSYYAFERMAVFYGIKTIDGQDWHTLMSEKLMANQMATGQFIAGRNHSEGPGSIGTSAYALLFLKKATKPLKNYAVSTLD